MTVIDYFFIISNRRESIRIIYIKCDAFAKKLFLYPTLVTSGSPVGRLGAIADVSVALLHTPTPVVTEAAGSAAVTRTTGAHPGRHPGSLLQVETRAVDHQIPDTSQEAFLLGRCSPCDENGH